MERCALAALVFTPLTLVALVVAMLLVATTRLLTIAVAWLLAPLVL